MSRLHLDARVIEREVADLIAAYPDLADDEVLRADAVEGETQAHEFLSRVARAIKAEEAMADATKAAAAAIAEDMRHRQLRAETRAKGLRNLAFRILTVAKPNGPVRLPEATMSIANVAPKLEILDETQVPDSCFTPVVTNKLNREAIKGLFDNGQTVPGARMSDPSTRLNLRWV